MTDEEKIRECIELVWDYEENYDGDDLLNFQNKELSTYTQHESVVTTFNKYIQLEKENAELKAENKQIIERERVVPEHYLCEMIEKCKELKAQIEEQKAHCKAVDEVNEKMKCCETEIQVKAMNRFLENLKLLSPDVYKKYCETDFVELRRCQNRLNQSKG